MISQTLGQEMRTSRNEHDLASLFPNGSLSLLATEFETFVVVAILDQMSTAREPRRVF